jgi:hypothetical protein
MVRGWLYGPLREAVSEGSDAGGGTGAESTQQQPQFDPTAFRQSIMADLNKTLNGFAKSFKSDIVKTLTPAQQATQTTETTDEGTATQQGQQAKPDAAMLGMQRQVKQLMDQLTAEREARQATESKAKQQRLTADLRSELQKNGVPADRLDAAVKVLRDDIRYSEDGENIVGGSEEMSLGDYISAAIKNHEYLLPPKPVSGAGATPARGSAASKTLTFDSIKPGMSDSDFEATAKQIASLLGR